MLKMSFYDGTLNKEKLKEYINSAKKEIRYTHGLGYRGPRIHKKLITKEEALEIIESNSMLDANENTEYIHLNTYSANDMF